MDGLVLIARVASRLDQISARWQVFGYDMTGNVSVTNGLRIALRVLTTQNATHRHKLMQQTITAASSLRDLDWSFFHAIPHTAAGLSYSDLAAYKARGRTLSPAELSCFASHYQIIKDFLEFDGADYILICEDDIFFDPWFDFNAAAQLMQAAHIDYLRLYARAIMPARLILYWERFQLVRFSWTPGGTQAYVLSKDGARKFVAHVQRSREIVRPIDDEIDRFWEIGNPVYALHPWPVLEFNAATTVHGLEQVQSRMDAQKALKAQLQQQRSTKLADLWAGVKERLLRRRADRGLRIKDTQVAQSALALFGQPSFNRFRVEPSTEPSALPSQDKTAP